VNVGFPHLARVPPTDLHIPILGHLAFGAASARRWLSKGPLAVVEPQDTPRGGPRRQ
jgi:hypothetical protein